nr:reverse transcriptase domain-containing protein [Tanacetum cinerariifolium]
MTQEAINNLIAQRVAEALAEYETQRNSVVTEDTSNTTGTGPRTVRPTRETEYVFSISNCIAETQVKFASCTLIGSVLTWWNSHMRAVSQEVAYAMPWRTLKQMMTAKYCPRGEIEKLEVELWNLKVKGTNITSYTIRFQKLTLLCGKMFPEESGEIERRNNNVAQANAVGSGEKPYRGTKPLCPKSNFYHDGPCRPKCTNCKRTGHIARDYRSQDANPNYNNNNNWRATVAYQGVPTCFECGAQ